MKTKELFFPWFAPDACQELEDNLLKSHHLLFEWGAGKSTIWAARRVKKVISTEHDREWFDKVDNWLKSEGIKNVTLRLVPLDRTHYEDQILKYHHGHFDVIMIDGRKRVACIRTAISRLKPGGFMIVDNSEREEYRPGLDLLIDWKRRDWEFGQGRTSIFWRPDE